MAEKKKPAKKRSVTGPWGAKVDTLSVGSRRRGITVEAWHYRESKRRVVVEVRDADGWVCTAQVLVPRG